MARRIGVEIVGDSRLLERAFLRSSRSAKRFNAEISGVSRGITRSFAGASAAILGGAGLVHAIRSSIAGASDLGEQVSKTEVVFAQSGDAVVAWSKTLANAFGLSEREALTVASSFGAIFRPLGFTTDEAAKQSKQLTELGADLASFYNTSVTDALDALRSGIVGQARPLLRYGVIVKAARVQTEALRETGKRSAKQLTEQEKATARLTLIYKDSTLAQGDFARTSGHLAQQTKIAQANIENLRDSIGIALVPAVNDVVSSFNEWLQTGDNQKQLVKDLKSAADALVSVFNEIKDAISKLNSVTGSGRNTLKLLLGILIAYKSLKILGALGNMARGFGLIGTNAKTARGSVAGLRGALTKLRALGPVTIAVVIAFSVTGSKTYERIRKQIAEKAGPLGRLTGNLDPRSPGFVGRKFVSDTKAMIAALRKQVEDEAGNGLDPLIVKLINHFRKRGKETVTTIEQVRESIGKAFGAAWSKIFELAGGAGRPTIDTGKKRTGLTKKEQQEAAARERQSREASRQRIVDLAELAVDRAGLTKSLTDDLAALNKLNTLLKRRIAGGHDTIELERQQLGVEQQIRDLRQQQAEARKAARSARQFRILGLGPTGEQLPPTVKGLKRELGSVEGLISGTFLDTKKTRSLISRIRRVLKDGMRGVSAEVRQTIKQMLDDLENQVKNKSVDTTKFHKVAPGILGALGLNEQQRKVLSRILPQLGPGGVLPTPSGQFAAAGAGPIVIQIDGKTVAKVTARHHENEQTRRRKQRARARRGTR